MEISLLTIKTFNKLKKFLPTPRGNEKICSRIFISCVIWVVKGGHMWCEVPEKYGNYDSMRKRFARWSEAGIFKKIFEALASKAGKSNTATLDSTYVKAHRTSASLAYDGSPRDIGRSHGGLTSKIHLLANIEKKPLAFVITGGQVNDAKAGIDVISANTWRMKYLLADKAYDTNKIRDKLKGFGVKACIPPKSNRKNPAEFDYELYKKRSTIENMFAQLKDWRGIAMRYCRCSHIYESYVCIALMSIFYSVR